MTTLDARADSLPKRSKPWRTWNARPRRGACIRPARALPPAGSVAGRSETDMFGAPRRTRTTSRTDLPQLLVAIEPDRQLFNGTPGLLAAMIDDSDCGQALACYVGAESRLLRASRASSGCRSGPHDRDRPILAAEARSNLASMPWAEVRCADGLSRRRSFDAILVNAGVTRAGRMARRDPTSRQSRASADGDHAGDGHDWQRFMAMLTPRADATSMPGC